MDRPWGILAKQSNTRALWDLCSSDQEFCQMLGARRADQGQQYVWPNANTHGQRLTFCALFREAQVPKVLKLASNPWVILVPAGDVISYKTNICPSRSNTFLAVPKSLPSAQLDLFYSYAFMQLCLSLSPLLWSIPLRAHFQWLF